MNSLLDANDILNIIKKAAIDAVNASQPSDFCFGKVISEGSPSIYEKNNKKIVIKHQNSLLM